MRTSDRLSLSHPTKDGRATDSCFALIGAHRCGMLLVFPVITQITPNLACGSTPGRLLFLEECLTTCVVYLRTNLTKLCRSLCLSTLTSPHHAGVVCTQFTHAHVHAQKNGVIAVNSGGVVIALTHAYGHAQRLLQLGMAQMASRILLVGHLYISPHFMTRVALLKMKCP